MTSKAMRVLVIGCATVGVLSLLACTPNVVTEVVTVDTGCVAFDAIRPEPADIEVISDSLVDQILIHNEVGHRRCGWKARDTAPRPPPKPP